MENPSGAGYCVWIPKQVDEVNEMSLSCAGHPCLLHGHAASFNNLFFSMLAV